MLGAVGVESIMFLVFWAVSVQTNMFGAAIVGGGVGGLVGPWASLPFPGVDAFSYEFKPRDRSRWWWRGWATGPMGIAPVPSH